MLLGLHTYSLYHHGIAEDWAGFRLPWPRQMDLWQLMDYVVALGLDGIHMDPKALDSMDDDYLRSVGKEAGHRGLYVEYNFAMQSEAYDANVQQNAAEGLAVAEKIGADVAKVGMNVTRPKPVAASKFHPDVMSQLEGIADQIKQAAPMAEAAGIRIAVENHTDAFSEEVLWVLDRVDHPWVGACVDTVNGLHVTEDPMVAIQNLAPRAFTNHFRDNRIIVKPYGFKLTGCAVGDGDLDMKRAYELIGKNPIANRINIETDLECPLDDRERALRMEHEALERSVRYCREVLGI